MFCPQFRPIVGGAERQAEKLSKSLVRCGVKVTLITPRFIADTPLIEEDEGVLIHRFPLFDLSKHFSGMRGLGPVNLLLMHAQVQRAMSFYMQDADVLHTHIASPLTAFAMRAARRENIPVLCKVAMAGERNDLRELSNIGTGGPRLARLMVRDMTRWVATTHAVEQSLSNWNVPTKRVSWIPNGVELPDDQSYIGDGSLSRRFLYLGRLSSNVNRDLHTVVRAFDRLADEMPDAELCMVGGGDQYEEIASLVSHSRNRERIMMPGFQDPELWLRWGECLVLPSRREGLSNALLEAMAHGIPCIANDIPPNREVLDNGSAGILVPIAEEERLYEAMLRIAANPNIAKEYGDAALRRVRECYSIDAIAGKYIELYGELLSEAK